jgi:C-terminal processing protease CtpA/Prc
MNSRRTVLIVCAVLTLVGVVWTGFAWSQSNVRVYASDGDRDSVGWLGVNVRDVTTHLKSQHDLTVSEGAYVSEVIEDSPAEKAGIKEGDVIVGLNGSSITDSDDLVKAVRKSKPSTEVKIEVRRKGESKSFTAQLDRAPKSTGFSFDLGDLRRPPSVQRLPRIRITTEEQLYGLTLQPLTKQLGEYFAIPGKRGVLVTEVKEESPAAKAGFRAGDVIVKVEGAAVRDVSDVMEEVAERAGKSATLDIIRKEKPMSLKLNVPERNSKDLSGLRERIRIEKYMSVIPERFRKKDMEQLRESMRKLERDLRREFRGLNRSITIEAIES